MMKFLFFSEILMMNRWWWLALHFIWFRFHPDELNIAISMANKDGIEWISLINQCTYCNSIMINDDDDLIIRNRSIDDEGMIDTVEEISQPLFDLLIDDDDELELKTIWGFRLMMSMTMMNELLNERWSEVELLNDVLMMMYRKFTKMIKSDIADGHATNGICVEFRWLSLSPWSYRFTCGMIGF